MSLDLHDALTTLAAAAPRSDPPTTALLRRVHQRRASRALATSAVGVVTAGAAATSSLGWWPDLFRGPAPAQPPVATPATEAPVPAGSTAPWDLYPGASIDVATAPTRTVTEALAALTIQLPTVDVGNFVTEPFLMDATDGAWVRPAWAADGAAWLIGTVSLSPDGRTLVAWVEDADRRGAYELVDVATGARTPVTGVERDGSSCLAGGASYAPDGTLALLTTCDPEAGPLVVFTLAPGQATATPLVEVAGVSLASGGTVEYSPDGSLLAISGYEAAEPYTARTVVVDASGAVVREWPAALRSQTVWYGNDALRASELERTDEGEWKGYLIPSTGAAVGEIRSYDESTWEYGPAPALLGATHGQEIRAHGARPDDAEPWVFDFEDTATGMVRTWLPLRDSAAPSELQPTVFWTGDTLALRTR